MEFIKEFLEKAKTAAGSFDLKYNSYTYHYMKDQVGSATYIYEIRCYGNPYGFANISNKAELVAILLSDTLYLVSPYSMGMGYKDYDMLPEKVVLFSKAREEKTTYMQDILLPFYYVSLETEEISDDEQIRTGEYAKHYCLRIARKGILNGVNTQTYIKELIEKMLGFTLSEDEFAHTLCGFTTVEELARKQFENKKDRWTEEKALIEKIRSYTERTDTVEDWELAIAESIRNIDAKNITVELKKDSYSFTGKMDPRRLMYSLQEKETLDRYAFNGSSAERAGADVGFGCEHIVKISYGKKVLFTR